MASHSHSLVPMVDGASDVALRQSPWRMRAHLSSLADGAETFLANAKFEKGPWIAAIFATGIAAWFVLPGVTAWMLGIAGGLAFALAIWLAGRGRDGRSNLVSASVSLGVVVALGVCVAWARSELVGAEALTRPMSGEFRAVVLERIEEPAEDRVRLVLATRHPETDRPMKIRINVPAEHDAEGMSEGALIDVSARLMPPSPPMLPGAYNFARAAWFQGFAATGSAQGDVSIVEPGSTGGSLKSLQRTLSNHVRSQLGGSPGAIAAAFASGDRGAISAEDEDAMRDAGLTHLLSISGLHVSAVIAATFLLAAKLLALWPWFALRVRVPLVAAATAAVAGIGYTLLTGAEVPTVRSCVGALLVLIALALGREPLSLRMVAVAAGLVLLVWPESLVGPSFQMSFAAVIAIVALHNSAPVKSFLRPREEGWLRPAGRRMLMLLVTGMVIELALMPIVLFHFHRAGVYGALANVVAIPLVTFVSMPLIAFALFLDLLGLGAPAWWLAGKSLDLLLAIAHFTSSIPGAVKLLPQMSYTAFALFVLGGLWLALWQGRARLWGFAPALAATALVLATPVPDLLISGDGRHVGITETGGRLVTLRDSRSDFARDNLLELAGVEAEPVVMTEWPAADCSSEFCTVTLRRGGRDWSVLMSRSRSVVAERALAAACERSDIVISDRYLPSSCKPRWLKADRRQLNATGGMAIVLDGPTLTTVAESEGEHGWWRGGSLN